MLPRWRLRSRGKLGCDKENAQDSHSKEGIADTDGKKGPPPLLPARGAPARSARFSGALNGPTFWLWVRGQMIPKKLRRARMTALQLWALGVVSGPSSLKYISAVVLAKSSGVDAYSLMLLNSSFVRS